MKILMRVAQALLGLMLAGAIAVACSTWIFPGEGDGLWQEGEFRLGVSGAGAGLALLVTMLFANGWIGVRKRLGGAKFPGMVMNGLGFGLLPGAAVYKAFEQYTRAGMGKNVPEDVAAVGWLMKDGVFQPCRVELCLAALLFGLVVLWLAVRKEDLPENGDLMPVSATLWAGARLVTEDFRDGTVVWIGASAAMLAAVCVLAVNLVFWTVRTARQKGNMNYALACFPVFAGTVALILLEGVGVLTVNPAADLAIRIVCALLAIKAVICMGRISRSGEIPHPVGW